MSETPSQTVAAATASIPASGANKRPWHRLLAAVILGATIINPVSTVVHLCEGADSGDDLAPNSTTVPALVQVAGYEAVSSASLDQYLKHHVRFMENGFSRFMADEGGLDKAVKAARGKSDPGSQRLQAWQHMIDVVKTFPAPEEKIAVIQLWASTAITYESDRPDDGTDMGPNWVRPPETTLTRGTGECADFAAVIAVSEMRAGIPPADISFALIDVTDMDGQGGFSFSSHAAVFTRTGSEVWAIDRSGAMNADFYLSPFTFNDRLFDLRALYSIDGKSSVAYQNTFDHLVKHELRSPRLASETLVQVSGILSEAHECSRLPILPDTTAMIGLSAGNRSNVTRPPSASP